MNSLQMKTQHISKKNDLMDTYPQENSQEKKKHLWENYSKKIISLVMRK